MREEETLTWSAGGDGDDGEALAGHLASSPLFLLLLSSFCFLSVFGSLCSVSSVFISCFLSLCLCLFMFLFSVLLPLWKQGNGDVMEDWSASCFLPPLLVAFLCGLLCFFEKKQGNNKSTLFSLLVSCVSVSPVFQSPLPFVAFSSSRFFSLFSLGSAFFFLSVFPPFSPVYAGFLLRFSPIPHCWLRLPLLL